MSEHQIIYVYLNILRIRSGRGWSLVRYLTNVPDDEFATMLSDINWMPFYESVNIDDKVSYFVSSLSNVIDYFAPITIKRRSRRSIPWINAVVRRLVKLKKL